MRPIHRLRQGTSSVVATLITTIVSAAALALPTAVATTALSLPAAIATLTHAPPISHMYDLV